MPDPAGRRDHRRLGSMRYLGHSGYCELTCHSLEAVAILRAGKD